MHLHIYVCVYISTYTHTLTTSFLIERLNRDLKAHVHYLQICLDATVQCPETQRE